MSDIFICSGINTDVFTPSVYKIKCVQVEVCDMKRYTGFHSVGSEGETHQKLGGGAAFQE